MDTALRKAEKDYKENPEESEKASRFTVESRRAGKPPEQIVTEITKIAAEAIQEVIKEELQKVKLPHVQSIIKDESVEKVIDGYTGHVVSDMPGFKLGETNSSSYAFLTLEGIFVFHEHATRYYVTNSGKISNRNEATYAIAQATKRLDYEAILRFAVLALKMIKIWEKSSPREA